MWVIILTLFMMFVSIAVLVLKFELKVDYPFKAKMELMWGMLIFIAKTVSNDQIP